MTQVEEQIKRLLEKQELDLRSTKYRYMDQKVTPDVLAFIADCILNLPAAKAGDFTRNDIWHSDYFAKNVELIYNKPSAKNKTMVSEYDKFIAQPLKTLSYAGLLEENKVGVTNHYSLKSKELLEYISLNDRNAFNFLRIYLEAVLKASGYFGRIENYIQSYQSGRFDANTFAELKDSFIRFTLGNSRIRQDVEIRRIFPKVLNIFAVTYGTPGTVSGRLSDGQYLYSDLMYNGVNFRDIAKNKNESRQEAAIRLKQIENLDSFDLSDEYSDYEMRKAMDAVKKRHYPNSEVRDKYAQGLATQVHHIFSQKAFPKLKSRLENLILLTPQQHNTLAHPRNNTQYTDPAYQVVCLIAKTGSVKQSVDANDGFYSQEGLVGVINKGYSTNLSEASSFATINNLIRSHQLSS